MTRKEILEIEKFEDYPSLSIFIPTHKIMPQKAQNKIKIKEMLGIAAEKLLSQFDKKEVLNLIVNLDDLAEQIDYTKILDGLAIFINKNIGKIFNLPFKIDERIIINKKFAIKELLSGINRYPGYYALILSKSPTRFFLGHGNTLEEIIDSEEDQNNQKGFPFKLNYDVTSDRELLAYGTGDKDSGYLTELDKNFFRLIDNLISKHLKENPLPLIILTTDKNKGIFEKITKNSSNIIGFIQGDYSKSTVDSIEKIIEPVIKGYLDQEEKTALNLFKEAIGSKKHSFGIKDVWNVIQEGRARILLIEKDFKALGTLNPENPNNIILKEDTQLPLNQDLVDDLIDLAIKKDTKIVFVQPNSLKEYGHIGAILRY